eukprot:m.113590 g.113590  ORF g.113590 m.113590 type:complete len:329 (-) comp9138_c0_seq1:126-1112(-)
MLERLLSEKVNVQVVLLTVNMIDRDLSADDWKTIEHLTNVLNVFYVITVYMSSQKHNTSSLVSPMVHRIASVISVADPAEPALVKSLKNALRTALSERLMAYLVPNSVYRQACALDPRWKAHPINTLEMLFSGEVGGTSPVWAAIALALEDRRQARAGHAPASSAPIAAEQPAASASQTRQPVTDPEPTATGAPRRKMITLEECLFEFAPPTAKAQPAPTGSSPIQDQIVQYRALPVETVDIDPLAWWRARADVLPDLFEYAMHLFVMQATETPSERAFSWAGAFYNDSRGPIDPQVLADYMFVYSNDPILKKARDNVNDDEESEETD